MSGFGLECRGCYKGAYGALIRVLFLRCFGVLTAFGVQGFWAFVEPNEGREELLNPRFFFIKTLKPKGQV